MRSYEHRYIGDAATHAAMVNVGGESVDEAFWLSFGDVVAVSGDFFPQRRTPVTGSDSPESTPSDAPALETLFDLARVPGQGGTRLDTRDEIVCALKVATVDEAVKDPRFAPGGRFGHFAFSPRADRSDVERAVRDRYLSLAAVNDDHFVAPGPSDVPTGSGFGSAPSAYHHLHRAALEEAWSLGRAGGDLSRAMAKEAAAQHYLTDAFASGHLARRMAATGGTGSSATSFWEQLQRRVASETASALRKVSWAIRLVPAGYLHRRTLSELTTRTGRYPKLSMGDLVARCLHDWDNAHGLELEGGGVVFGDGYIGEGATIDLALSGVRAGNDDIEVAFGLGASGRSFDGEALYEAVRHITGATGDACVAENRIPRLSAANPRQNWHARDAETLWDSPIVGNTGTTVGEALVAMLEPGGQFIRQLDSLGEGLAGSHGVLALPVLGPWLAQKCCHAFHAGFVEPLARDPQPVILSLAHGPRPSPDVETSERRR